MGAKVQQSVYFDVVLQVAIERAKRMGRRGAVFKQQAHRIPFVAKTWLHSDGDVAELNPEHKDVATVGQLGAG